MNNITGLTKSMKSILFRIGNSFHDEVVRANDMRKISDVLEIYYNWSREIPYCIRWYFDDIMNDAMKYKIVQYEKRNIRSIDGKLYSRKQLDYFAICN
jgi:hypothetical protein